MTNLKCENVFQELSPCEANLTNGGSRDRVIGAAQMTIGGLMVANAPLAGAAAAIKLGPVGGFVTFTTLTYEGIDLINSGRRRF